MRGGCSRIDRAALVSGVAYLFAPYLLTVVYERGAAAEALALGLLPWTAWALHRSLYGRGRLWLRFAAILVALLILAHNITALFALSALAVYLGLLVIWERRAQNLGGWYWPSRSAWA